MSTWFQARPSPSITPFGQGPLFGGRLFVHVRTDPYALVTPITRTIRDLSVDQPVERAATLEDVRAEVLTPDRLNAMVFGGFAVVALTIAVVGVARRTGIFGERAHARIRHPAGDRVAARDLLGRVLKEGVWIAAVGIVAGILGGLALTRALAAYIAEVSLPGVLPTLGAAAVLVVAALLASLVPAARAARVDVIDALRPE